jgi:2-polyprenyl-3-methyl-5-hydroxy-6-metoxy-1,4-benzoquinol methylase
MNFIKEDTSSLQFERFPFFIGVQPCSRKTAVPAYLPFELTVDGRLVIPRLRITQHIRDSLNFAYSGGSMLSTPLGHGTPLTKSRLHQMLKGIMSVAGDDLKGQRFLEVGCGSGELLVEIRSAGADVFGCEIGPQGQEAARKYGIPILEGELTKDSFGGGFDCIYSYGCLEHIIELEQFLDSCRYLLKPGGLLFHTVPNTALTYKNVQTTNLCHQHINYFTPDNGIRLLRSQGFRDVGHRLTDSGNELHLHGRFDPRRQIYLPNRDLDCVQSERLILLRFAKRLNRVLDDQKRILGSFLERGESIGFYAGGFTTCMLLNISGDIRFYDGDEMKHGKCWLTGLSPILSPRCLKDDPVDRLVICPDHHYREIKGLLDGIIGRNSSTKIHLLSQFEV